MTERLAKDIREMLNDCSPDGVTVECRDLRKDPAGIEVNEETVVVIGMPVYVGKIPLPAAEALKKVAGSGALTIVAVSYGGRSYGNALFELKNLAEDCGFRPVGAGAFLMRRRHVKGSRKAVSVICADADTMADFEKASAAKIKRLVGCEIEELKVKPMPVEVKGRMPVHKVSRISPKAAAAAQRMLEKMSVLRRRSEWFL